MYRNVKSKSSRLRRNGVVLSLAAVALAATACGASGKTSTSRNDNSPGIDVATKTITIGSSGPRTGNEAVYYEIAYAAQAAVNRINASGGINGWKLKFTVLDDGYNPARAVQNVKQLVENDHVFAVVTLLGTPIVQAALPYLTQHNIPTIGFVAEAGLTVKYPNATRIFPANPAYANIGAFMVDYANRQDKAGKVSFAFQDDASGDAFLPGAQSQAKELGMPAGAAVPVPDTATDFSAYASKLKAAGAPAVLLWGPSPMAAGIIKSAAAIGYHPQWMGSFFTAGPSFVSELGSAANGVQFESWYNPFDSNSPGQTTFLKWLKSTTPDHNPSPLAEGGWISMNMFAHGLSLATQGGKTPTRDAVVNALNNGQKFTPGDVGASYTFSSGNRIPKTDDSIYEYQGGKLVKIFGPAPEPTVPKSALQ